MKKIHIALLVLIAASIAVLISFLRTTTTYDTIATAMAKNANFLSFTALDTTGRSVKVVYHNAKPDNLEVSERLVLKGKYQDGQFECKDIQTKCPSKYKEDMKAARKNIQEVTK
jgi:cytochrome c-type biogenesis protein CcmE